MYSIKYSSTVGGGEYESSRACGKFNLHSPMTHAHHNPYVTNPTPPPYKQMSKRQISTKNILQKKMFRKFLFLLGIAIASRNSGSGTTLPLNPETPEDLSGNIIVENYRLSVFIQDRYVRSEVAVHVKNTGSGSAEYDFRVKLDENEFISGLTMRVGEKVTHGEVHEKAEAKKIYNQAKERGENAGLTTQNKAADTSFNTKVNIPAGENAYIWLTYDQQLERSKSKYDYKTHLAMLRMLK